MKCRIILLIILSIILVGCSKKESNNPVIYTTTTNHICNPLEFEKDYSYVFYTKDDCEANGMDAVNNMIDSVNDEVYYYSCDKIVDDCDNTYYGISFIYEKDGKELKLYY